ncbi:MAG: hypothetical protein WCC04_03720 [Terriglobales bacterium]
MSSAPVCYDECRLAHFLNNKLATILWTCDVLSRAATDPEVLSRLQAIREAAKEMTDEINKPLSQGQGA